MAQQPHFSLKVTTAPSIEPVSLSYVKQWLRIDSNDHDQHLADLITMARTLCEDYSERAFINTGYTMYLDRFPLIPNSQYSPGNPNILAPVLQNVWPLDPSIWAIKLPRSPLQSVSSIAYIDAGGTPQTMDPTTYILDAVSEPARLSPATGSYWPQTRWQPNAATIVFTAGYGTTQVSVPAKFRRAIVAAVGYWYDQPNAPTDDLPAGVKATLNSDLVTEVW